MLDELNRDAELLALRLKAALEGVSVVGEALQREVMNIFGGCLGDMVEPDA